MSPYTPDYDPYETVRCPCGHLHVQHGTGRYAHPSARAGCWWCPCGENHDPKEPAA